MMRHCNLAIAAAVGMALGLGITNTRAQVVPVSSYVYDNGGDINVIAGKEDMAAAEQALIDGLGRAGEYVPGSVFWAAGEEGVIFLEDDANILSGQPVPSVTFDLGSAQDFEGISIHYGVATPFAVVSPESVEVLIDNVSIGTFGQQFFNSAPNINGNGDIRVNHIDVGPQNGQIVTLLINGGISGLPAAVGTSWQGLTEVEFTEQPLLNTLPINLLVDRDSGEMSLQNRGETPVDLKGYTISSAAGALDPGSWSPIADGDSDWTDLTDSNDDSSIELSEYRFGAGTGITIPPMSTFSIGSDAWIKSNIEDLQFEYVDPATFDIVVGQVEYESVSGEPFLRSDLDTDGDVDADDWIIYVGGLSKDLSTLPGVFASLEGDLDGDVDNDLNDLNIFRADYDAAQGAGAFAAMIAGTAVPEPSGVLLTTSLIGLTCLMRRRRRHETRIDNRSQTPEKLIEAKKMTRRFAILSLFLISLMGAVNHVRADRAFTYEYDTSAINGVVVGFDAADSAAQNNGGLSDGIGVTGYMDHVTAGLQLWEAGSIGTIFQDNTGNPVPQPRVTLTVTDGGTDLNNVTVYYFERTGSAVTAPDSIIATVGGDVRSISADAGEIDVDQTNGPSGFGVIRQASIDLTGLSNSTIQLDLTNIEGLAGFNGEWTGITEIVVDEAIVRAQVDRSTGEVTLYNPFGDAIEIDGYQLLSTGGSLDTSGWNSLDDQNVDNMASPVGDYNGDNTVNLADYTVWRDNLGATVTASTGADGSGNGSIGQEDYDLWKQNFGEQGGFGFGWFEGGGSHANDVSEARLFGGTSVVDGSSLSLGNLYNTSVDSQDLLFRYSTSDGVIYGLVDYVNAPAAITGSQIPEPSSIAILAIAGIALTAVRRSGFRSIAVVTAVMATLNVSFALELDREYLLGDNTFENAVAGTEVGSQFFGIEEGLTFDSNGTLSAGTAIDLIRGTLEGTNNASYISVSDRPGAGDTLGVAFDGTGDYLVGPRLGFPATSDAAQIIAEPKDYAGIADRGLEFWAKPDSAGQGTSQSLVLDTNQHGVRISENDTWVMRYFDGGPTDFDTGVSVDFDTWSHVMLVWTAGAGNGARLYIDGVAIGAAFTGYDTTDNAPLVVGANTGDTTTDPPQTAPGTEDFYNGVIDDLSLFVFGTTSNGVDYGDFDYTVDNPFAAAALSGIPGDVDQVNGLTIDDLNDFVAGWYSENVINETRAGDLTTILNGDLNLDGITDLRDAVLLDQALIDAGLPASIAFNSDGAPFVVSHTVPEPTALGSAAVGACVLVGGWRRLHRRRFC